MEKAWFKKSMDLGLTGAFEPEEEKSKCDAVPCGMNAFDIISMSSGLDLSGLFEVESRMERRFTAEAAAETVVEKVAEVGERLGYKVEKGKSGVNVGLGKRGKGVMTKVVMAVEVKEVALSLVLGEVKMAEGGGVELDQEARLWEELRAGLQDFVVSWHNVVV